MPAGILSRKTGGWECHRLCTVVARSWSSCAKQGLPEEYSSRGPTPSTRPIRTLAAFANSRLSPDCIECSPGNRRRISPHSLRRNLGLTGDWKALFALWRSKLDCAYREPTALSLGPVFLCSESRRTGHFLASSLDGKFLCRASLSLS